jgi:hypothetical protein
MSGGGGSTQTNQIPQWVQDAGQDTYNNVAKPAAAQTYTPYTGEQVAPINAQQQSAFNMAGQNVNLGQGALGQGVSIVGNAGIYGQQGASMAQQAAQGIASYQPSQVGTSYSQDAVNQQLNPYTQSVIDSSNAELQRQNQIANANNDASATQVGAYGGTRNAVQDALTNEAYSKTIAQNTANLNQANYTNAQSQALAQQQLAQSAQQSNQSAGLQQALGAAQIGNQSAGVVQNAGTLSNQSGTALGLLGTQQQSVAGQGYTNLLNAGNILQQQQQNEDSVGVNQYTTAQNWPLRQLSVLEGAINQTPYNTSTTQSGSSNTAGSALGGAAAGAAVGTQIYPGWGTAIGAGVGLIGGLL